VQYLELVAAIRSAELNLILMRRFASSVGRCGARQTAHEMDALWQLKITSKEEGSTEVQFEEATCNKKDLIPGV
jgi:hypothetical protein